ncbi:MAG: archaeosortase A [Thermoplasmata archaeon]|nr:MAG: archaeosortase A [Thermoplasmata archaeon]
MKNNEYRENIFAVLFLIIPTILLLTGFFFFPDIISDETRQMLAIPLFSGLILLMVGFILKKEVIASKIKIIGWVIFTFYWAVQPKTLYFSEDGDFVNAFICIIGVYVLFYIAYHEWLSTQRKEYVSCLNWIAGASAIAGLIYFGIELTPLSLWLREIVASQSGWLLNVFTGGVQVNGVYIKYKLASIMIIFACTAVQSFVIFIGMILSLQHVDKKRKIYGLLVTVLPVYFLNLVRNAGVVYLVGIYGSDFFGMAHNIIGKSGSLIALIILLFILIKIVPEVFDEIMCLTDLYKRNGPMEKLLKKMFLGRR